jgi:hypothetical protein
LREPLGLGEGVVDGWRNGGVVVVEGRMGERGVGGCSGLVLWLRMCGYNIELLLRYPFFGVLSLARVL